MNRLQRAMHESPPTLDFAFPSPVPLVVHLRDVLDDNVDAKYFIDNTELDGFIVFTEPSNDIHLVGRLTKMNGHDLCKRVYEAGGVSPCIATPHGNTMPKVIIDE